MTIQRPKPTKSNIMLLLAALGVVILIITWYQIQSILWNRVPYNTGSGWQTAAPVYQNSPIDDLRHNLTSNLIIFLVGYALVLISTIYLGFQLIRQKLNRVKQDFILLATTLGIIHFVLFIIGLWLYNSPWVIATLKLNTVRENPGQDWIYGEAGIGSLTPFIEIFALITVFVSLIATLSIVSYLVVRYFLTREKPKVKKTPMDIFSNIIKHIPFYVILIAYLIFTLLPVYLTIKISISTFSGVLESSVVAPLKAFIENYSSVAFAVSNDETQFGSAFLRSIFLGLGTGVVGLTVAMSAAYSLARFKFKGNKLMSFLILSTQMFPGLILLIPQYIIWSQLNLLSEKVVIFGVLLASSTGSTAYCTWMMKGYFESVPIDIEEAAIIDGAGRLGTFTKIAIPLVKSGIIAVLLFTLITSWQDFVLARTFISQETKQTLPLLFYNFQDMTKADAPVYFDLVAPYSIMVALPIVIFFMVFQKDLAAGAVAGGVK